MQQGAAPRGRFLAFLKLLRLPNVFTVIADVMMGFLFVRHSFQPGLAFACLAAASCFLYLAGMVLNDVFDLEVDRQERPHRPLPSGQISLTTARIVGWSLLLVGWLFSLAATLLPSKPDYVQATPVMMGTLLAIAIVAYDAKLKSTMAGPVMMGLCRFLNVLMAMSYVRPTEGWPIWGPAEWIAASAIGLHIAGVTWVAREEASESRRTTLVIGLLVIAAGWSMLGWLPSWLPARQVQLATETKWYVWYFLVVMLAGPLARRLLLAITAPEPATVQTAVRQGIWSLIWIDATIVLLVAPLNYALLIVVLFVPMMALGRWVYST